MREISSVAWVGGRQSIVYDRLVYDIESMTRFYDMRRISGKWLGSFHCFMRCLSCFSYLFEVCDKMGVAVIRPKQSKLAFCLHGPFKLFHYCPNYEFHAQHCAAFLVLVFSVETARKCWKPEASSSSHSHIKVIRGRAAQIRFLPAYQTGAFNSAGMWTALLRALLHFLAIVGKRWKQDIVSPPPPRSPLHGRRWFELSELCS